MSVLGIDIGGSTIKAAIVNPDDGTLVSERICIATALPAAPTAVANQVAQVIRDLDWQGEVGCGLPAVVKNGVVKTAANIDPAWVGLNIEEIFAERIKNRIHLLNDADAAGLAEIKFGAAATACGTTLVITAGTGLGSALFRDRTLVPNTELGHLGMNGTTAEKLAAAAVKTRLNLSFDDWAKRLDDYLHLLEELFWPDLFVIGGEISREHTHFLPKLTISTEIRPAALRNDAGLIGAALASL